MGFPIKSVELKVFNIILVAVGVYFGFLTLLVLRTFRCILSDSW